MLHHKSYPTRIERNRLLNHIKLNLIWIVTTIFRLISSKLEFLLMANFIISERFTIKRNSSLNEINRKMVVTIQIRINSIWLRTGKLNRNIMSTHGIHTCALLPMVCSTMGRFVILFSVCSIFYEPSNVKYDEDGAEKKMRNERHSKGCFRGGFVGGILSG